jgi:hypothetical protein
MFSVILDRLKASGFAGRVNQDQHALWLPIDVPLDATGNHVIQAIVKQAEEIAEVAYAPLPAVAAV